MKVRLLVEAQAEAVEAAFWYDEKRSGLGYDFLSEVGIALEQIGEKPQSFSRWESYEGPHEIRRAMMRRFPYSVLFIPGGTPFTGWIGSLIESQGSLVGKSALFRCL